jgi:hypothetical protein
MGRGLKIALVATASVTVLALLVWLKWPRDEPSRATVGDAVRSFRAEDKTGGRDGKPTGPPLGVYRYATRGSESVDSPVLNTSHDYNGISTIVLSAGPCAERERWQVLDGRWTEGELCPGTHGTTSGTVTEFHEFFGTAQRDAFHCHGDAVVAKPGSRLSSSCRSDSSSIATTSHVLRPASVLVDDVAYDATQIDSRSIFGGENSGTALRREWRRRSDGLLLRRTVSSEADTSLAGGTHYSEQYTIRLLSTTPRR